MYVLPDDDSQIIETCWRCYILNFKYKLILTYWLVIVNQFGK